MKNEKKKRACAQGPGRVRRGHWLYGQSYYVSSWWTAEERQKGQTTTAKTRAETRPKKARADRNEVVGFRWIWIYLCLVFRGDLVCVISQGISRYIVTSCPVSCGITRYGISRYRIISMLYPDFLGLIWRCRIPSIDFSIPNTIFCQLVRCTKLGAPREQKKRLFGDRTSEAVILIGKCTLRYNSCR